jgi:periplasmic protein TonB
MQVIRLLLRTSLLPDVPRAPLWAQPRDEDDAAMPLWKAALLALALEALIPLVLFGIDWSKLGLKEEPPVIPVMSVKLDQPPPEAQPMPPQPKPKPQEREQPRKQVKKRKNQIAMEQPRPQPSDPTAKIQIPKPEPEPKPEPPKPKIEPKPPPEPEAPPLPTVFRDVKPVKKVKPVYPAEAEQQHIQGSVKVRLNVDVDGNVTDVQVLSAEPPGVFEEAVLTAVKQYKFKKDGTSYQADQQVVFKIDD